MTGKVFTILLVTLFALSFSVFAKDFNFKQAEKPTAGPDAEFMERLANTPYTPAIITESQGRVEVGRTWYDVATNWEMGRKIAHAYGTGDDGIHAVFMKVFPQGAERYATYDYYAEGFGIFLGNASVDQTLGRSGWPSVINAQDDEAIVVFHSNTLGGVHIYKDASEVGYNFSELWSWVTPTLAVFPGIARHGDRVVFLAQADNASWVGGDTLVVSTDYMQTWTGYNVIPLDPLATASGAERWPSINPTNPDEFSYVFGQDISAVAPEGEIILATSPDFGATYNPIQVHADHEVLQIGGNHTTYDMENFPMLSGMYTQDGVYHLVAGGVQGIIDTALSTQVDIFPILYWNNVADTLIELTDDVHGRPADPAVQTKIADTYPGFGLGNAYPQMSEGPSNPQELVAIWQQWEDDGAGGIVTTVPAGGSETFLTDIWGCYSSDGGQSWTDPVHLIGNPGEADVFPSITKNFIWNATNDSVYLDILWLLDTNPHPSTTNFTRASDPSECIWYYERVAMRADPGVGIEDGFSSVIDKFSLSQNYPNPFNPTTTIEYSLEKAADISLEVYNVTGEKVATLVKERKTAGEYRVTLDAANLSSGVYFYTLRSGDIKIARKMVLMK